jgi:quercetin dioxygenase-like cupin family protein
MMQSKQLRKGQVFQVPGTIVTFLAVATDTHGAFSLFEYRVAPGQGIPFHTHNDDEAFLILEGSIQFQVGDQQLRLEPGEFTFVARHTPHMYRNANAEQEGRMVAITLPAGYHEQFFAEIGEPEANASAAFSTKPLDIEKIVAAGKLYGFEILPPPSV